MKLGKRLAMLMAALLLVPGVILAQQANSPSSQTPAMTHLRVDIVLSEYSGDKKISSLPYTMYVGVKDQEHGANQESLRMGVRVPMATNAEGSQFNYQYVGTDIDCYASSETGDRYRLQITIDRSSVYSPEQGSTSEDQFHVSGGHPVLRSFNARFDLALRDGETGEGISATDPFNGHVLKVSVTIHVVK